TEAPVSRRRCHGRRSRVGTGRRTRDVAELIGLHRQLRASIVNSASWRPRRSWLYIPACHARKPLPTRDARNDASARANSTRSLRSPGVDPPDDALDRAADAAMLGARARTGTSLGRADRERLHHDVAADADPAVRAAALTALVRAGVVGAAWR